MGVAADEIGLGGQGWRRRLGGDDNGAGGALGKQADVFDAGVAVAVDELAAEGEAEHINAVGADVEAPKRELAALDGGLEAAVGAGAAKRGGSVEAGGGVAQGSKGEGAVAGQEDRTGADLAAIGEAPAGVGGESGSEGLTLLAGGGGEQLGHEGGCSARKGKGAGLELARAVVGEQAPLGCRASRNEVVEAGQGEVAGGLARGGGHGGQHLAHGLVAAGTIHPAQPPRTRPAVHKGPAASGELAPPQLGVIKNGAVVWGASAAAVERDGLGEVEADDGGDLHVVNAAGAIAETVDAGEILVLTEVLGKATHLLDLGGIEAIAARAAAWTRVDGRGAEPIGRPRGEAAVRGLARDRGRGR